MRHNSLIKPIVSIGLAVAIGYLGLKAYLHYQITKEIDDFIYDVGPYAQLNYQSISTNLLKNSFSVQHIYITPVGATSPLKLEEISFVGANFFNKKAEWFEGWHPNKNNYAGVKIKGLAFKLDEGPAYPNQMQQINLLQALGYASITSDIFMSVAMAAKSETITIELKQYYNELFSLDVLAQFSIHSWDNEKRPLTPQNLKLSKVSLSYTDQSFLKKFLIYQANLEGLSLEEYKSSLFKNLAQNIQSKNILLSEQDIAAIKNTFDSYQSLQVSIEPNTAMGLDSLQRLKLYAPSDVSKMLNLKFSNP